MIDDISGIYSVDLIFLDRIDSDFARMIRENGVIIYERKSDNIIDKEEF